MGESGTTTEKPLLHLVFGGRVKDPQGLEFEDLSKLDIVGIFPNYREAFKAWQAASQAHVDDALMKYVIVHLHRLLDPEHDVTRR
ncbi:MAG: inositol monophosphatase [Rhodothalassiaceae bacterium]|nr:MAG: inositol monophosphatase [Rhodothalassiaceae bacterium]